MLYEMEQAALIGILDGLEEDFRQAMRELGIRRWQPGYRERLLVWRQLALQYDTDFIHVVRLAVTRYRRLRDASGPILGLSFPVITGPKAVAWLREELRKERKKPASRSVVVLKARSPEEYAREAYEARTGARRASAKAFRGSPEWVRPTPDAIRLAFRV